MVRGAISVSPDRDPLAEHSEVRMSTSLPCPECGGEMEEGYVPDHTFVHFTRERWFSGKPSQGMYGLKNIRWRQGIAVSTFRCAKCGYLKSYAKKESS